MRYQIIGLGPNRPTELPRLIPHLEACFRDLGLDPTTDFQVLDSLQEDKIENKGYPVAIWFGGTASASPADLGLLRKLLAEDRPVLPLVDSLQNYGSKVPDELKPINGRTWSDPQIASDILRMFELTRDVRRAFISYRRIDAQPIADQLFDGLTKRGYLPFLDVASIESGAPVQEVLRERLANIDLVIFLDSPTAPQSNWILEELVTAAHLGLGVLQIVWPSKVPYATSGLSRTYLLNDKHFENDNATVTGKFKDDTVAEILQLAESERIQSLASRRRRVVSEFLAQAKNEKNLLAIAQPFGPIELRSIAPDELVAWVIPFVGLPDGKTMHDQHYAVTKFWEAAKYKLTDLYADSPSSRENLNYKFPTRIVFDSLGVREEWLKHLKWLGAFLPAKTLSLDRTRDPTTPAGVSKLPVLEWLEYIQAGGAI